MDSLGICFSDIFLWRDFTVMDIGRRRPNPIRSSPTYNINPGEKKRGKYVWRVEKNLIWDSWVGCPRNSAEFFDFWSDFCAIPAKFREIPRNSAEFRRNCAGNHFRIPRNAKMSLPWTPYSWVEQPPPFYSIWSRLHHLILIYHLFSMNYGPRGIGKEEKIG
jgi:hypothetical protein